MTVEEFQNHWRTVHAEAAVGMPGILRYWQNHRVLSDDAPLLPWPGFDACSEIDATDLPAHIAMRVSPAYLGPIAADEPRLLDTARSAAVLTRRALSTGEVGDGVRLLTFMRQAPLFELPRLGELLIDAERGDGALGREVFVALRGRDATATVSAFDAVEALWFADPAAAVRYLGSPAAERDRWQLSGIVLGTERLLVHVNRVV
jgi:hypothetical protein